jgi:DNA-binding GntR family transcriptional regulator
VAAKHPALLGHLNAPYRGRLEALTSRDVIRLDAGHPRPVAADEDCDTIAHVSPNQGHALLRPAAELERVSTVDALVQALRQRVLNGSLPPGSQLREIELAGEYGVGRHSLRTALQALVYEGLFRHEPHRGVFVREFTGDDVEDLFLLRVALESEAARLLVKRKTSLTAVAAVVEELERLTGAESWDTVTEIDLRFHRTLVEAVESLSLARAFASMQSELGLLMAQIEYQYPYPDMIGAEHRLVLDAIESGDIERAVAGVRTHLEVGVASIVSALESRGVAPSQPSRQASGRRARQRR